MAVRLCAMRTAVLAKRTFFRLPYVKYSTGANRAICMAYCALGKPNWAAARRAFLAERTIGERHAESKCLFCATALFRVSSALFFHIFSRKREKIWPAERRMRLRKPHRASGAFETRRRRHSAPFRRTRNNPIAGAQNGASASVQDTNPVQMIPEQKQGNAYERTA